MFKSQFGSLVRVCMECEYACLSHNSIVLEGFVRNVTMHVSITIG